MTDRNNDPGESCQEPNGSDGDGVFSPWFTDDGAPPSGFERLVLERVSTSLWQRSELGLLWDLVGLGWGTLRLLVRTGAGSDQEADHG